MNLTNLQILYKAYPLFNMLDEKIRKELEDLFIFRKLLPGEYLKNKNINCPGFMFILKGKIKIEKIDEEGRQTNLYEIGVGELCHESLGCYLECEPLNIVGYALSQAEVAILPMEVIKSYLVDEPIFWQHMYVSVYHKLRNLILNKQDMLYQPIQERLLKLLKSKGSNIIYMTHQEIALELGTAREVVSRKLKELEKEGVLKLERGKIKLV